MSESTKLLVFGLMLLIGGGVRILWPDDERWRPWDPAWLLGRHRDGYAKIGGALVMLVGVVMIWGWTTTRP